MTADPREVVWSYFDAIATFLGESIIASQDS
jgi:hypothetical protein